MLEEERRAAEEEEQQTKAEAKRKSKDILPTGRVIGVAKRNWRRYISRCFWKVSTLMISYVCHVDRSSLSAAAQTSLSQQTIFATPVSRALPRIRLRTKQAPSLIDQKILVSMDRWLPTSRYPDGHFVKALGKVGSKEAEQESLLLEYEVPYRPFGKAILGCLPTEGDSWKVPPKSADSLEWRDREDLRELIVCSIDPPGKYYRVFEGYSADIQVVRISTMPYMLGSCPTAISRLVSVSCPTLGVLMQSPVS